MTTNQIFKMTFYSFLIASGTYLGLNYTQLFAADFESITPRYAYQLTQDYPNMVVLDVRTPEEYKTSHITKSKLIPVQSLEQNLPQLTSSEGKKIIVYCASGNRSVYASRILIKNGFIPLNVKGGLNAWKKEGLQVTTF